MSSKQDRQYFLALYSITELSRRIAASLAIALLILNLGCSQEDGDSPVLSNPLEPVQSDQQKRSADVTTDVQTGGLAVDHEVNTNPRKAGEMLQTLSDILPVPKHPIDIDESALARTTAELKVQFPKDYLEYARIYGSGTIVADEAYSWEIISPFRENYSVFVRDFFERQDSYRSATDNFAVPLGLFPEPGGLLPFGHRDDLYFAWKTVGNPEEWNVVVIWLYEPGGYQTFEMGFTEFLLSFLTHKITITPFKTQWNPETDLSFEPEIYGL